MKKTYIFVLALSIFISCNKTDRIGILSNEKTIKKNTCFSGFVLIQYLGEENYPIKSLLIRTDIKDTTYLKFIRDKDEVISLNYRKYALNEIILSNSEFEIIRNYIFMNNTQKKKIAIDDRLNSQQVLLIDKCDTIDYIVDRTDTLYFNKFAVLVNNNKALRKCFEYCNRVQER